LVSTGKPLVVLPFRSVPVVVLSLQQQATIARA
jgi:hypothetical protein